MTIFEQWWAPIEQLMNDKALLPDRSVYAALFQTAGRGQKGNRWESRPGENLTFSLLLKPAALAVTEQFIEGMTGGPEEEPEPDEHIWLSLRNAELFCGAIADALGSLDPKNADTYAETSARADANTNAVAKSKIIVTFI